MMTKSPVKVTVTEGRRHVASFPGENVEYNLALADDLEKLRDAIEDKMNRVCKGKTISSEVVSLNIQGKLVLKRRFFGKSFAKKFW